MLRIILIIGNAICGAFMIYTIFTEGLSKNDYTVNILIIAVTILLVLNVCYLLGIWNKTYLKRKRMEEEIKIQEAENKLKELQNKSQV